MSFSKLVQFLCKNKIYSKPNISILIPAFNAQEFICETLDSLNNQTFKSFQILISIDKSDDNTGLVVERWCKQHKIPTQIFYQESHIGWVKNINFLLTKCDTKYFMMLPHDDLIHQTYLHKMYLYLEANPSTCVAFSDIQGFGKMDSYLFQKSIKGDRLERMHDFLTNHLNAIAVRGLVNKDVFSDFISLPENNYSNTAVDTIWNMQMVLMGDMIRIPEVLYYKRYHGDSVHSQWWKSGKEDVKTWLEHCKDCLKLIFMADFKQEELIRLTKDIKSRLIQENPICPNPELLRLSKREQDLMINSFEQVIVDLCKSTNNHISLQSCILNP